MGHDDDPFDGQPKERLKGKTFWLKSSTLQKLAEVQKKAINKNRILEKVKDAIDMEVDRLSVIAETKKRE